MTTAAVAAPALNPVWVEEARKIAASVRIARALEHPDWHDELDVEAFNDEERWCAEHLQIQTKQGVLQPAIWGPSQHKLFEAIAGQRAAGKPVRIVALKPRQVFWSTGVAMKFWKETAFLAGQRAMVYAHDDDSAQKIFEYYKRFHDYYTGDVPLSKTLRLSQKDGIVYANGSAIEVHTAGNVKGGRSRTARRIHLSEHAFYRDAATLMTGLLNSVPDDPDTYIVVESTANGMGGPFWEMWSRAVEGKSDFLALFMGWWEHSEYTRALSESPEQFQDRLTREEAELKQQFNLTLEQLNWRRWAIANNCEGDEDRFRQEFPSTAEEAFIVSGRPRFRPQYIRRHVATEGLRGELRVESVGTREVANFSENEHGALTLWGHPEAGKAYVIGADPSEGVDVNDGGGTADPDYSSADVFDFAVRVQVAQLRERITPAEFGRYLYDLGRWYNWAFLVVEVNAAGLGTLEALLALQYPTDRIYKRPVLDERGHHQGNKLGWRTTEMTRKALVSGYEAAIAGAGDGGIILRSRVSIQEAMTYVIRPGGREEAQNSCHDDTVFSGALAVRGLMEAAALGLFETLTADERGDNRNDNRWGRSQREQAAAAVYGEQDEAREAWGQRFRYRM